MRACHCGPRLMRLNTCAQLVVLLGEAVEPSGHEAYLEEMSGGWGRP